MRNCILGRWAVEGWFFVFGYVRPYKPELLVKEYTAYQAVYCGLCKRLGKSFGVLSRLTLSYDCTFLAMLALSRQGVCPGVHQGRCVVNPLKKCAFCTGADDVLEFAGAFGVITTYYKVKDDIQDSGFFKRLALRLVLPFAARGRRKAAERYPEVERLVARYIQQQAQAEQDEATGLDAAAQPTAQMLSDLMVLLAHDDETAKRVLEQYGYFMGRWIYFMDAADDIEKDRKTGNFNPFIRAFSSPGWGQNGQQEENEYCNAVLNQTAAQANAAFSLLEWPQYGGILGNVMQQGLAAMQKQILFDKDQSKEKEHVRSL